MSSTGSKNPCDPIRVLKEMKLIYLKSAVQCNSFDATIGMKIPSFRVSVIIEPDRSLLQFVTTNCLITDNILL